MFHVKFTKEQCEKISSQLYYTYKEFSSSTLEEYNKCDWRLLSLDDKLVWEQTAMRLLQYVAVDFDITER